VTGLPWPIDWMIASNAPTTSSISAVETGKGLLVSMVVPLAVGAVLTFWLAAQPAL